MNIAKENLEILKEYFSAPKNIVVLSHTNPDGDAIGSSLSLKEVLSNRGHNVHCILPNAFPYYIAWVPGASEIIIERNNQEEAAQYTTEADIIICCDVSSTSRFDEFSKVVDANTRAKRVLIDHHLNPDQNFDVVISCPEASSASYIMFNVICDLFGKEAIDAKIGTQLFVGMMTDTGNFSYSTLTPDLFRSVATLVEAGIDIPAIHNSVYNSFTEGRARLFGYAIDKKMKLILNGTVGYMSLTMAEMRRFWFKQGDSEGFVNYPMTIKKVKMSALFSEQNGFIRVSLRSRGDIDVNIFARRYFNGGGHKNAAGGKSFTSMAETIERYINAVNEYHNEGNI